MIRNLKALGLALVAVFAMSAMAAVGAHAEKVAHFEIGEGTVTLDIAAEGHQVFAFGSKTKTCTVVDGHAEVTGATLPTEITATDVNFTTCHTTALGLSFPTTFTPETNCHYTFTAGTWTNGSSDAHGSVHICGFTIDVYNSSGGHTEANMRCQTHILPQTVTGLTYTNKTIEGKMAITIDVNAGVTETVTDFNTLGCNTHEHGTITYSGSIWLKGTDQNGLYTDVTVMGTP